MKFKAEYLLAKGLSEAAVRKLECLYKGDMVEIYQVAPTIYFRKADLKVRGQCNSIFIEGNNSIALVDPSTQEAAHEISTELALLFKKPLGYVFLTHAHKDHAAGLPVFLDKQVVVFCSNKLVKEYASMEKKATIVGIENKAGIDLGGVSIELLVLGDTAHSPWDMLIGVQEEKILCTGDFVVEYPALFFHYAYPEQWETHLRELSQYSYEFILPGHGGMMPFSVTGELADYLRTLRFAARYCLDSSVPGEKAGIDLSYEELSEMACDFLAGSTLEAGIIKEKAGGDAMRELRMMMRLLHFRGIF
ncbi:MAG: MBL fold metallo-hydrolase [Synergistaceae bacterium]|jgi:glyoxylase-like metal-dependent hydrolase (beta-lactamase superfamily II)|nr:MBL fold metallo-hydrolase [Synergistaceae bacterium]